MLRNDDTNFFNISLFRTGQVQSLGTRADNIQAPRPRPKFYGQVCGVEWSSGRIISLAAKLDCVDIADEASHLGSHKKRRGADFLIRARDPWCNDVSSC